MYSLTAHTRLRRIATRFASAFLLMACSGGEDPQVPTAFAPSGGSVVQVVGTVATAASIAPQVQILDAKGRGIRGLLVRWRVGGGSGSVVNDSSVTDGNGVAFSGGWTLGTATGVQTLTATADGVSPITFTAVVAPGAAANLVRLSPDGQQATVNTAVAVPPSVRAQDRFGNPVPGVTVTFSVVSGGGSIQGAQQTTDANGVATAGAWILGPLGGQQMARVTAPNTTEAVFSATALPGPPVNLIKIAGDNQSGVAGLTVPIAPGVRVVDAFNNPVGNVPVTFTPGPNSGTVTGGILTTDPATGTAFVGSWILGNAPVQTLVATSSMLPGKSVTFTAMAVQTQFDIDVRFIGEGGTPAVRDAFVLAAAKWRRMIVGHVHTVTLNRAAGDCLAWVPAFSGTVNDLVIFARIGPIDSVGKIVARAGPCIYNDANFLPVTGVMEFDEADLANVLANNTFNDVVLHEMGHVLGVGTLWNLGRNLLVDAGTAAPYFTGPTARAEFAAMNTVTFSGNAVPVEGNAAPAGTRDGHWRESVLGRELMQGFVKVGGMPLSRLTVGSLKDMGYVVDLNAADPYFITAAILQGFPQTAIEPRVPLNDALSSPMIGVDAAGRMIKITPRRNP